MVDQHTISSEQSAKRNGVRAKGSIGFYERGTSFVEPGLVAQGFEIDRYEPSEVIDKFPKMGNFGPFDAHVEKRWDLIEHEMQKAEHAKRWVEERPELSALVVWEDFQPHGVGLVDAANRLKIPTIMLTHGSVLGLKPGNFGNATCAKYVCATWAIRDMYRAMKQEIEVIPTGIPQYDPFFGVDKDFLRVANRKDLGWSLDKPVITWVGTWNGNRTSWQPNEHLYFRAFVEAFKALREIDSSVQLNVCPHPNSNIPLEWYKTTLETNGISSGYKVLPDGTELWITGSDLLVGAVSSVMTLGLLLDIPSVILDFKPWHEHTWYRYRGFELVENVRELTGMLAQLFATTDRYVKRKKECKVGADWFTSNRDGQASKRVARVITRLARGDKPDELCYAPVPQEVT